MKMDGSNQSYIRNFAFIAHIDHGKSTMSDRLIEMCGGLELREMRAQILDSLDIERERGITIKAQCVRLLYKAKNGSVYTLNLMDTPGHADFAYEVDRCLAACEGSVLIVDLTQGVEAQTMANLTKAIDNDHEIILALNKADLPTANPEAIKEQISNMTVLDTHDAILVSAKVGIGIEELLETIVAKIPAPRGILEKPLKCLLVDSWYDKYLGVVILVRVIDGVLKKRQKILMMGTGSTYFVESVGYFTPKRVNCDTLSAGEIGFITASIKTVSDCKIGDTITDADTRCDEPLKGFKVLQPFVFCSLFPTDADDFESCRECIEKLHLNDASFTYELENSPALGYGFRCGFLGLLHLEIVKERLEREYNMDLITTYPSVVYHAYLRKGELLILNNPVDMPDPTHIEHIEEPWATVTIISPKDYLGSVLELCIFKRGEQKDILFNGECSVLSFDMPLSEIVYDFYDKLKSVSKGYASVDWHVSEYRPADVVKLSIMVNSNPVDPLSCLIHRHRSEVRGREICARLKELIPRQMYKVAIQAAIGGKIIAREDVSAMRKDVTAKCYGGDVTRKKKLLEKQKKGKARMRTIGNVEIPKDAFIDVLKTDH